MSKTTEFYLAKGEEGRERLEAWQKEMDSLNRINSKETFIKKDNGQFESLGDFEKKLKKKADRSYRKIKHFCDSKLDIRGMI